MNCVIINRIRTERKEYIETTPAGAKVYSCSIYDTVTGSINKGTWFEYKNGTIDISHNIYKK